MKEMKNIAPEERANFGKGVNELKEWAQSEELVGPIHEWYVQYLTDAGLDGQAIYDQCVAIVEELAPAHEGDWDAEFNYKDWQFDPMTYGK